MHWTLILFLGLENFVFLISALHIDNDRLGSQRERTLDYISRVAMAINQLLEMNDTAATTIRRDRNYTLKTRRHLSYNTREWVGIEVI
jgi:hypothetical protein